VSATVNQRALDDLFDFMTSPPAPGCRASGGGVYVAE